MRRYRPQSFQAAGTCREAEHLNFTITYARDQHRGGAIGLPVQAVQNRPFQFLITLTTGPCLRFGSFQFDLIQHISRNVNVNVLNTVVVI